MHKKVCKTEIGSKVNNCKTSDPETNTHISNVSITAEAQYSPDP